MSGADDAWKDQVIIVVGLAVRRIPIFTSSCLNSLPFSRSWWALPPRYCRCIRFPMRGIVLRLPILHKHEQKRGRLETSDGLRFARASPSSSRIKGVKNLRRSKRVAQDT
jgi:hypothetical protein